MSEKPLSQQVKVDLHGLREVAAEFDGLAADLQPEIEKCKQLMHLDPRFGRRSPSGYTYSARFALAMAISQHYANGRQHVAGAKALSLAIDQILASFHKADELSTAKVETIQHIVMAAIKQASPVQYDPEAHQRGAIA